LFYTDAEREVQVVSFSGLRKREEHREKEIIPIINAHPVEREKETEAWTAYSDQIFSSEQSPCHVSKIN
jgi:hypothetical protein